MVDIQDVFSEYERYKKNPKQKNKERLITALFFLFRSSIKVINCCSECDDYEYKEGGEVRGPWCHKLDIFLDHEKSRMVGYRPDDCPYKMFDEYVGLIDELRKPDGILYEKKLE